MVGVFSNWHMSNWLWDRKYKIMTGVMAIQNWFRINLWMNNSLRLIKWGWENIVCECLNEWNCWMKERAAMYGRIGFTLHNFKACYLKCGDSVQLVWSCTMVLPSTSHIQSHLIFLTLHSVSCVFPILQAQNLELREVVTCSGSQIE